MDWNYLFRSATQQNAFTFGTHYLTDRERADVARFAHSFVDNGYG